MTTILQNNLKQLTYIKEIISDRFPIKQTNFGKMIRSKLGILTLLMLDLPISKDCIKFLSTIEIIHNASLFHDDILDEADIRRDSPTVNKKNSLLYGNILMSEAIKLLLETENITLLNLITSTLKSMCKGELLQLSQIYKIPDIDSYLEKSRLKTGVLFEALFEGLTILYENKFPPNLKDFGRIFGITYQIKNDLKDVLASNADIEKGIYTLPVIYSGSTEISKNALEKTIYLIDNYKTELANILLEFDKNTFRDELIRIVNNV